MSNKSIRLAIIGGSGLYEMPGLVDIEELEIDTPFGKPSAPIIVGTWEDIRVAFLSRHGMGHRLSPTEVNYRANIFALKKLGTERILSVTACGSLREDYAPGDIVIPDQLFDFTKNRERTFFNDGLVAHISVADPFCPDWSALAYSAVQKTGATVHKSGSFITIEGPRFSTRAESNIFRSWGISIIGMTASPEAFLAREAEICYAAMAHVTDYDVWHLSEEPVTAEMVFQIVHRNLEVAQQAIGNLISAIDTPTQCNCSQALAAALSTRPDVINPETRHRVSLLVDKYLKD
jgi:5'-methylthioadenosine phosphorylase